jgi:hypothetical protein
MKSVFPSAIKNSFHTLNDREAADDLQQEPIPLCYFKSQIFALELLTQRSNGIVSASTRDTGGPCIACFRPPSSITFALALGSTTSSKRSLAGIAGAVSAIREAMNFLLAVS